ncbi:unnamed protein product [Polarella glacialis]|uniref:CID domain-containing protein n=1 Tax=Polarella glacialis TaxID=89957 RepID=A0A813GWM9_POLGL|nr:unnamed protein product [Polarella glacialis]
MSFCMDNAAQYSAVLSSCLMRSLVVPDLETDMVIARLFLMSDVLFNSQSGAKGSARYRSQFEEPLPDVFEHLGRLWLARLQESDADGKLLARAEVAARGILSAWQGWDVFPSVFIGGLESLLLAAAPEPNSDPSLWTAENESDPTLRQKLARWCSEVEPAELRVAARRRGLSGPNLPVAICRLRFCHYERYWHRVSASCSTIADLVEDEVDSVDGESISDGDVGSDEEDSLRTASLEPFLQPVMGMVLSVRASSADIFESRRQTASHS